MLNINTTQISQGTVTVPNREFDAVIINITQISQGTVTSNSLYNNLLFFTIF